MSLCWRISMCWVVAMVGGLAVGCAPLPKDVTNRPDIRAMGVVGRTFETTEDVPVWRDRKFGWLTLAGISHHFKGVAGPVGTLPQGVRLRIYKAEEHTTYYDGLFAITPVFWFARIEAGPLAGQQIEVPDAGQSPETLARLRLISSLPGGAESRPTGR
jgi:hypothetical protein